MCPWLFAAAANFERQPASTTGRAQTPWQFENTATGWNPALLSSRVAESTKRDIGHYYETSVPGPPATVPDSIATSPPDSRFFRLRSLAG